MRNDFPSRSQRGSWKEVHGRRLLARARRSFDVAVRSRSEPIARRALQELYTAFNWLEDTDLEARAHSLLHKAGGWTRRSFPGGCTLTWTGERYEHRCPVNLAHLRMGFSPGMVVAQKLCSICGEDISECPHLGDREYSVPGGPGPLGRCRVCGEERCGHSTRRMYWVRPVGVITRIEETAEISIVSRPRQPDARILGRPIDRVGLEAELGPAFRYGLDVVSCSQCLETCQGFQRLPGDTREPMGPQSSD